MEIDWESLLGIAYNNNIFISIIAAITFSFMSFLHVYLTYKYCTQNKYLTKEQATAVLFSLIYVTLFLFLVPLTSIILAIFFAIKLLYNKETQY